MTTLCIFCDQTSEEQEEIIFVAVLQAPETGDYYGLCEHCIDEATMLVAAMRERKKEMKSEEHGNRSGSGDTGSRSCH